MFIKYIFIDYKWQNLFTKTFINIFQTNWPENAFNGNNKMTKMLEKKKEDGILIDIYVVSENIFIIKCACLHFYPSYNKTKVICIDT